MQSPVLIKPNLERGEKVYYDNSLGYVTLVTKDWVVVRKDVTHTIPIKDIIIKEKIIAVPPKRIDLDENINPLTKTEYHTVKEIMVK